MPVDVLLMLPSRQNYHAHSCFTFFEAIEPAQSPVPSVADAVALQGRDSQEKKFVETLVEKFVEKFVEIYYTRKMENLE